MCTHMSMYVYTCLYMCSHMSIHVYTQVRQAEKKGGLRAILNWGPHNRPQDRGYMPVSRSASPTACLPRGYSKRVGESTPTVRSACSTACPFACLYTYLFLATSERPFRCYPPIRSSPRCSPSACPERRQDYPQACLYTGTARREGGRAAGHPELGAHDRPRHRGAMPAVDAARRGHLDRHGQGSRGVRASPTALYRHRRRLYIGIADGSTSASPTALYQHCQRL